MHGVFDKEDVVLESRQASQSDEEVAQPAPSKTPAAMPQTILRALELFMGALGSVL